MLNPVTAAQFNRNQHSEYDFIKHVKMLMQETIKLPIYAKTASAYTLKIRIIRELGIYQEVL